MNDQPIKLSSLHANLIANGANMINIDGWISASSFSGVQKELNAMKMDLGITDISRLGKFKVESPELSKVLESTGVNIQPGEVIHQTKKQSKSKLVKLARVSTNELWITSDSINSIANIETNYLNSKFNFELFEITSGFTGIRIIGPHAPDLLSELTDLNVSLTSLKNLSCVQTMFIQVYGLLIKDDYNEIPAYDLFVDRAYGLYVWESIVKLGNRYRVSLVGTKAVNILESTK